MLARTAPALLAWDQERAAGHFYPLYGLARVPCATPRRASLDPLCPTRLRPVGQRGGRAVPRGKALEPLPGLDGPARWALAGPADCGSTAPPRGSRVHSGPPTRAIASRP